MSWRSQRGRAVLGFGGVLGSVVLLGTVLLFSPLKAEQAFLRADANGDGRVDIGDPIFTLDYNFRGGRVPPCLDGADANDDGAVDISDSVFTLIFLFNGGRAPPAPYPTSGLDPTADRLACGPSSSGSGTVLLAVHDTPPESLTEFWITIEEITLVAADGSSVEVFPPASDPAATKTVNLLDLAGVASIVAVIEVPAGDYSGLHLEFDGASAKAGTEDVIVVPDHGTVDVAFASPVTVTDGTLTALLVDFNVLASVTDGGPGKVLLEPVLDVSEDDEDDGEESELSEFHGTVVSVDAEGGTFVVEVTTRQKPGDAPVSVGQVTVVVGPDTELEDLDGLAALASGQEVEVEGTLKDDGTILASEVELKDPAEGEDLDDDDVDDSDEDPDHDSDIDNDGVPNVEDDDDDGDGISDGEDSDQDNDGIADDSDLDDDNDGVLDAQDDDDNGDGVDDEEEEEAGDEGADDNDQDGIPEEEDPDDDNDGIPDAEDPDA
ncbi:MAG: DUF4382 domain-containing protein, partial [Planctomycetes bacterium]|nr:DUF4382 domain-containing protein [Planctomycetota bacterium]